jgi:hypothetical protein
MLQLLVAIDHSLEASFALRTAGLFGPQTRIQPIYVFDPPGRDVSFGAGWARKSWERETSRQAEEDVEELVLAERGQYPNIGDPVVLTGEPVQELADYYWHGRFDLLVIGAPFRSWGPHALSRRFWAAAKRSRQELPLLVVRHLGTIRRVVVLTDGGHSAENALGLLVRSSPDVRHEIVLVGLSGASSARRENEALNLERGMAILKEKGIDALGLKGSDLGHDGVIERLRAADLMVKPYLTDDQHSHGYELTDTEIRAVLYYFGRD